MHRIWTLCFAERFGKLHSALGCEQDNRLKEQHLFLWHVISLEYGFVRIMVRPRIRGLYYVLADPVVPVG